MTLRLYCLVILAVLAIIGMVVSDRAKPIVVDSQSSGQWAFEKADYPICVTIHPGPIRRPDSYSVRPHGRRPDSA